MTRAVSTMIGNFERISGESSISASRVNPPIFR